MSRGKAVEILKLVTLLGVIISGCGGSNQLIGGNLNDAVQAGVQATLTKEAWLAGVEAARQTSIAGGTETGNEGFEVELEPNPATGTPEPTQTQGNPGTVGAKPVVHQATPGAQLERINTFVTDFNSIDYAEDGYTYGDLYYLNRYERPFTANQMEYRGDLDLTLVNWKVNSPWIFSIFIMAEELPARGAMQYAVELDLDENGRGDYLIITDLPGGEEWSTEGVRVLADQDVDVGSKVPLFADTAAEDHNGYETMVFNGGLGEDPDLAWSRRNPNDPRSIEIAFKESLVGIGGYMFSAWAGEGQLQPEQFDLNDRIPFTNAGSPNPDHPFYPIKAIALVDSTCRSWFGFEPTGSEPGICQLSTGKQNVEGFCPRYNQGVQPDCNQVCLGRCPESADFCIPCRR